MSQFQALKFLEMKLLNHWFLDFVHHPELDNKTFRKHPVILSVTYIHYCKNPLHFICKFWLTVWPNGTILDITLSFDVEIRFFWWEVNLQPPMERSAALYECHIENRTSIPGNNSDFPKDEENVHVDPLFAYLSDELTKLHQLIIFYASWPPCPILRLVMDHVLAHFLQFLISLFNCHTSQQRSWSLQALFTLTVKTSWFFAECFGC